MLNKLFLLVAFTCLLSYTANAQQCECNGSGITNNNDGTLTASAADAFFWNVCSGNVVITSDPKDQMITFDCVDGVSSISLTQFKDGLCTTTCINICEDGPPPPPPVCTCSERPGRGCIGITYEPCSSAIFTIDPSCLPDGECIESITWRIGLGFYSEEVQSNLTFHQFDIPAGNWPNHFLQGAATITLTNGVECRYWDEILISCIIGGVNGKGDGSKRDSPNLNSSNSFYPNPVIRGNQLFISSDISNNAQLVQLMDTSGKVVSTLGKNESSMIIPNSTNPGIYFVTIQIEDNVKVHRVFIGE